VSANEACTAGYQDHVPSSQSPVSGDFKLPDFFYSSHEQHSDIETYDVMGVQWPGSSRPFTDRYMLFIGFTGRCVERPGNGHLQVLEGRKQ
jgi:hypothetical protein